MSIKTKIAAFALATLAVTGALATTSTKAEAFPFHHHHNHLGLGVGLATAAIVGTAIAASNGPVYTYRRCGWAPRYNVLGQYIGSVRVCSY